MDYNKIISETEEWVKEMMKHYDCSHNFQHIIRVKKMAIKIAKKESLNEFDKFIVILGALTHDIADSKYCNIKNEQETLINNFFKDKIPEDIIKEVSYIACNTSLSKEVANIDKIDDNNIKLKCVQDADRLDSLGADGISRYFMYGIHKKNSNTDDIINNIKDRSKVLLKFIKTKYAKKISKKKYKIIKIFIKDYRKYNILY
jgi:uncharacterized protein